MHRRNRQTSDLDVAEPRVGQHAELKQGMVQAARGIPIKATMAMKDQVIIDELGSV